MHRSTFREILSGIIASGRLVCQQIAVHSAVQVDAPRLTERLRARGVAQLAASDSQELWLVADCSDLRKVYAQEMPALMTVRDWDGDLVPGYRTLDVLGVVPQQRGVLYHRLFSSAEADFVSEPAEGQQVLRSVSGAIASLKGQRRVTWVLDSGFDDVAVWRTMGEQEEQMVCRVQHVERLIEYGGAGRVACGRHEPRLYTITAAGDSPNRDGGAAWAAGAPRVAGRHR